MNSIIDTFSLSLKDKEIFHILSHLLKDHHDLVFFILNLNKQNEFLKNKEFHIENNFYNWLNFDLSLRNELKICTEWNIDIYCKSRCIKYEDYKNYSTKELLSQFGLDEEYTRTKSLNKCFNSDWWKTHLKKTPLWKSIHNKIISEHKSHRFLYKLLYP